MRSPTDPPLDVPDADAAEQSRELRPSGTTQAGLVEGAQGTQAREVDEFDAVEQSIVVDQDDEEEYR
ncbi:MULTISPECIES: hypothetical protein [Parafrankia]|uniref:Uncharacterized protein n=1 Tax=Parafrankia soli TaxID=2599596 RepID=A0A1S1RNL6_9ACTN|nr:MULTISPECIES: hypothetical protein [Parafrankia]OHV46882.1 hypothetical protein BBK14_01055 [Parafrankia soli]TCJ40345.1 hypothetical protein E0504_05675 [Parafrankia sp. BMG5.11]CAI7973636.1 conserved hypothetical protein [Frankia sp. Hr75.2]SQD99620.1 conserved hypothetical protein [Parafrankia sp. Ea1.12]